jgi:hypothetical protein
MNTDSWMYIYLKKKFWEESNQGGIFSYSR